MGGFTESTDLIFKAFNKIIHLVTLSLKDEFLNERPKVTHDNGIMNSFRTTCLKQFLTGGLMHLLELYSTLLHLPPLRINCVRECWDLSQNCCDFGIGS
jgi:hypothetical protein